MKTYFIALDFYGHTINKFFSTIVEVDLKTQPLPDIARQLVISRFPDVKIDEVVIKVTCFNNIEV